MSNRTLAGWSDAGDESLSHDCPCCGARIEGDDVWRECPECGSGYDKRVRAARGWDR